MLDLWRRGKEFVHENRWMLRRLTARRLLNVLRARSGSRSGDERCDFNPTRVDIVPTKRCNLDCIFCIKYPTAGDKDMTAERFGVIADRLFPHAMMVSICSSGEPFLNPAMPAFLDHCRRHDISTTLTTNGTFLDEPMARRIVHESTVDHINFSIDAACANTLARIRIHADFERVTGNLRRLVNIKREAGLDRPVIAIRYAVMRKNISELPAMVRLAAGWGVDEIHVNYLGVTDRTPEEESLFFHPHLQERYFALAREFAREGGIALKLPPDVRRPTGPGSCACYEPYSFIFIDTDGMVRVCYRALDHPFGDFFASDDFFDLWNGEPYRRMRRTYNGSRPSFKYCGVCSARLGSAARSFHFHKRSEDTEVNRFDPEA